MVPELVSHVENKERIENKGISQMAQGYPATRIGMIGPVSADGVGSMSQLAKLHR